jgi:hypothetical protein
VNGISAPVKGAREGPLTPSTCEDTMRDQKLQARGTRTRTSSAGSDLRCSGFQNCEKGIFVAVTINTGLRALCYGCPN